MKKYKLLRPIVITGTLYSEGTIEILEDWINNYGLNPTIMKDWFEEVKEDKVEKLIYDIMDNLGNHRPIVENILKDHIKDDGKEELKQELNILKNILKEKYVNYSGLNKFIENYIIIKVK